MKRLMVGLFCCVTWILVPSQHGYAQSTDPVKLDQLNQEQALKELVNEVRQLRLEVRRVTTNAYRVQSMVERLRLQQEQVNRLTLELTKVRTEIGDLKSARVELDEKLAEMEKKVEGGTLPPSEVNAVKTAIKSLKQREQALVERESQLTTELDVERGNLGELKKRLDELEIELLTIGKGEEAKPKKQ